MTWKRKKVKFFSNTKRKNYSIARKLRKEGRSVSEFEVMLNSLTLEEVIGLKLELAAKAAGGVLYGIPIWKSLPLIVKESVLISAVSLCKTRAEAASFLGMEASQLGALLKQYQIDEYFEEKDFTEDP